MKMLLILWFVLATSSACAGDTVIRMMKLQEVRKRIEAEVPKYRKRVKDAEKLVKEITLSTDQSGLEKAKQRLEEIRMVAAAVERNLTEVKTWQHAIEASPEYQLIQAVKNDHRKPRRDNLGGVWTSGPNMTGLTVQLNQRGKSITGQGYFWGCSGVGDNFTVTGTYHGEKLALTFDLPTGSKWANGRPFVLDLHYAPLRKRLTFQGPPEDPVSQLIPWSSIK